MLLTVAYISGVLFFRKGWQRINYFNSTPKHATKVSVLIAARNEEHHIERTIKDILAQNYPKELLEIIIADDHSTDRTAQIIHSFKDDGVTLLKLNETEILNSYKKKAITEAIKISTGELIVTTDADCRMGKEWLSTIVSYYQANNYKFISSPVTYFEEKNHFEKLQTLEFLYLIGLGASSIGNKMPSTCNGANLAYKRDVFIELKGFQGIDDLASGDDELFLHKVVTEYPDSVGFCKSADALVYTYAKPDLKEFIRQRKRWASKSTKYKNKRIVALGVSIWLFNVIIFLNIGLGFYNSLFWQLAIFSVMGKFIAETVFLLQLVRFIKRVNLILYMPVLSVIHIVYIIFIGIAGNTGRYTWKGRKVY